MTVENSSLLGYVLIISGIAIGILAYAIYLNLRDAKSLSPAPEVEQNSQVDQDSSLQMEFDHQSDQVNPGLLTDTEDEVIIDTPITHEKTASLAQQENEENGVPMPEKQDLTPVATILREVDTGNIIVQVDNNEYANVEDLKDSTHWSRIERLSLDLAEWLKETRTNEASTKFSSPAPKPVENKSDAPQSMVEEINQILDRKLKTEDVDRKAIKIIEMLDGTVKVYVGVDSYPIDEVPFEDVRALIQEAVSEWEGSR